MSALEVRLHGHRVGVLEVLDDDGFEVYRLSFDRAWWDAPARPVLGQWFEDVAPQPVTTIGPLAWFHHLLPQGAPRRAIAREAAVEADDDFSLLSYLGRDLPGAVVLLPGSPRVRSTAPDLVFPQPAPDTRMRVSLAGNQWKMSLRRGERPTVPLRGEDGDLIGKWPSFDYPELPRIELATMRWARASGLAVPQVELVERATIEAPAGFPEHEPYVFVIERFDRSVAGRIHMEDFAQVLGVGSGNAIYDHGSTEHIAAVVAQLCPVEDVRSLVERIAFCIACGNGDAHLKNWSIVYPDRRRARLSPAYDLVATVLYPRLPLELALPLGGRRAFSHLDEDCMVPIAHACGVAVEEVTGWVAEQMRRTSSTLDESLGFSTGEVARLREHFASVPLCRQV